MWILLNRLHLEEEEDEYPSGHCFLPPKNCDNMDIILFKGKFRAKSVALEKACSGRQQVDFFKCLDICWIRFSFVYSPDRNIAE